MRTQDEENADSDTEAESESITEKLREMAEILTMKNVNQRWTVDVSREKNARFRKKYVCDDEIVLETLRELKAKDFVCFDKNRSKKAKVNPDYQKQIIMIFVLSKVFMLKDDDDDKAKEINLYIKLTYLVNGMLIAISFHESERSHDEEMEYRKKQRR